MTRLPFSLARKKGNLQVFRGVTRASLPDRLGLRRNPPQSDSDPSSHLPRLQLQIPHHILLSNASRPSHRAPAIHRSSRTRDPSSRIDQKRRVGALACRSIFLSSPEAVKKTTMVMSWLPLVGSKYARVCGELLDMGARIAARSYSHCPQTARMYYKPPSTTDATGDERSSAAAASSCGDEKQQAAAAAATKVVFDASASASILYGRA
ncbi:hypothetical protein PR202_gb10619 [Eleusine coracana subsp. coracana]|uniref:Uncharacterized protein n=1 Tax=Eleusine coracana subsp. coracana TaxID=191504 RepID=A0AAV5EL65_ELECO|nr:hypothetical protein PR202_gb10619 [Eleusine coracana subsp. coracana]